MVALSWADTQVRPYPSGLDRRHPLVKILAYNEGMLSVKTVITSAFALLLIGSVALAQEEPLPVPPGQQPDEFERIIQQMKFEKPTRIVGRLQAIDGYEDAIWIVWTHVHDGRRWRDLRNQSDMMFKVFPRDAGMMDFFRKLKLGTSLHLTVQMDADGNRRVLSLDEGA